MKLDEITCRTIGTASIGGAFATKSPLTYSSQKQPRTLSKSPGK